MRGGLARAQAPVAGLSGQVRGLASILIGILEQASMLVAVLLSVELHWIRIDQSRPTQNRPPNQMTLARYVRRVVAVLLATMASWQANALDAKHLAVIINTADPLSIQVGEYYAARRRISFQNIIRIALPRDRTSLTPEEFEEIKREVDKRAMSIVQVFALTWAAPYRVGCMSITSAFAFGYDPAFCEPGCAPTRPSRYFNSRASLPHSQLGIRPTMAISATSFEQAKALIDRGVAADGQFPKGTAYLLMTSDVARNVRSAIYPDVRRVVSGRIPVAILKQEYLQHVNDILFYFTGRQAVEGLQTLHFVPGAIADHLTSSGGALTGSSQMSALRWLEAGATGSYGTVVEPCNLTQKFPNPALVAANYLQGDTLIEAYWKSVAMPGQGIFIGEPLAAPFRTPIKDR